MCGILGGWAARGDFSIAAEKGLARMHHRGPDDQGFHADGPVFLGMRRLSIIDLGGGHQPIFNEDRSVVVVCNGEIYNYRELQATLKAQGHQFRTESDTEVLVHLYEERGEAMVQELRGMFAFAIWDSKRQQLFLGRDRFGKKPLYYHQTPDGGLLFASEIKALLPLMQAAGAQPEISSQSVYDYLSLAVVPQPSTIYERVFALPPASGATFAGEKLAIRSYWALSYTPKTTLTYEDTLEQTRQLVRESVQARLRSDVPLGLFLSGGIDSSVVAVEAARELGGTLQTFTVASPDPALDESAVARRTAEALGIQNTLLRMEITPLETLQFVVDHYDQPFADSSAIPSCHVSRVASEHVKVVLNGDGGDELFAGYRRYLAASRMGWFRWLPQPFARLGAGFLGRLQFSRRSRIGFYARFARAVAETPAARYLIWTTDMFQEADKRRGWIGEGMRSTETWLATLPKAGLSDLDRQLFMDGKVNLLSDLLVKMDMATMSASLEARSPLLDHKLAEFAATLPADYLLRGGKTKAVLRDAYAAMLPDEVLNGPKRGFEVPMAVWLKGPLHDLLRDTVGSSRALLHGYLDAKFVREIIDGTVLQDRNWAYVTYALLVLELWLRKGRADSVSHHSVN